MAIVYNSNFRYLAKVTYIDDPTMYEWIPYTNANAQPLLSYNGDHEGQIMIHHSENKKTTYNAPFIAFKQSVLEYPNSFDIQIIPP